ncbi:MAG: hypothetical protein J1G01_05160 [Clostridiales bacterium]|nr:hypothetical protein [Clostridiales bacterium]
MKKAILALTACVMSATMLCGCGKSTTKNSSALLQARSKILQERIDDNQQDDVNQDNQEELDKDFLVRFDKDFEVKIDNDFLRGFLLGSTRRAPISGVRRRFNQDHTGTYTVEYIHAPYGVERDETIDYTLLLNEDNTFKLNVVTNGVAAEHYGHWYNRRNEIMMFYDEPTEQTAHNVYVADSMYGELLPQGKILIYDNCHTIILSRNYAVLYEK